MKMWLLRVLDFCSLQKHALLIGLCLLSGCSLWSCCCPPQPCTPWAWLFWYFLFFLFFGSHYVFSGRSLHLCFVLGEGCGLQGRRLPLGGAQATDQLGSAYSCHLLGWRQRLLVSLAVAHPVSKLGLQGLLRGAGDTKPACPLPGISLSSAAMLVFPGRTSCFLQDQQL